MFVKYLKDEEIKEREHYSLDMPEQDMFTAKAEEVYKNEREQVLHSARKLKPRKRH
ncbi:hypothetical protein D3C77_690650 [compost metagenome]